MNKKEQTTEYAPAQSFYQTGDVHPPKSYRGIIALLLIAVIFLGSLVSGLSLMNIHLFRQLQAKDESAAPVRFVTGSTQATTGDSLHTQVKLSALGFTGCILSSFDRHYYGLPAGIYITDVAESSHAAAKGICAGDILLQLDGSQITDAATLQTQLDTYQTGDTVKLVLYRAGSQYRLDIPIN